MTLYSTGTMWGSSMDATSTRTRVRSMIALATLAGIGLVSLQFASQYPESPHRHPGDGHHVRQAQVFGSIEAMSAASDVVIRVSTPGEN